MTANSPGRRWAIVALGPDDVDRVSPLWAAMVAHHRALTADAWPVRDTEDAWSRRRRQYVEWLETSAAAAQPSAWLLAAVPAGEPGGAPLGYAMLVVGPSGPTWDLGELTGELESLAVAEDARGCGVGGALIAAARATLRERGVLHWYVGVVGANAGAIALYEREGFRPFFATMLSTVEDATG